MKAGVSTGAVNRIERGLSNGIPRSLRRLAVALNVPIEDVAEMTLNDLIIESTRSGDGEIASCG